MEARFVEGARQMPETRQVAQIIVEDHIAELRREASALRAVRAEDELATPRRTVSGSRQRVGLWLVAIGKAIAGSPTEPAGDPGSPVVRAA
jgi:hypothetical protein